MAERLPDIESLDVVSSTNDIVLEWGRSERPHGSALLARRQTRGRGRRGHVWESPAGNVYLSVLLRPGIGQGRLPGIALACGLGALEGLDCFDMSNAPQVKWPNDLVVTGRKLGGMVIECGHLGDEPFAVCGIGVNVASSPALPPALETGAPPLPPARLADLLDATPRLDAVAQAIRDAIVGRVDAWAEALRRMDERDGTVAPLLGDYQARLYLLGDEVDALSPDGAPLARGRFCAVDEWGRAVVRAPGGELRLSPEQASLRPAPPPTVPTTALRQE